VIGAALIITAADRIGSALVLINDASSLPCPVPRSRALLGISEWIRTHGSGQSEK
jgi:hypothetical protein